VSAGPPVRLEMTRSERPMTETTKHHAEVVRHD
jgi:hypothetical protein